MNKDTELISEAYNKTLTSEADFTLGPKEQGRDFSTFSRQIIPRINHLQDIYREFVEKYCMADHIDPYDMDFRERLWARRFMQAMLKRPKGGWAIDQKHFIEHKMVLRRAVEHVDLLPELAISTLETIIDIANRGDKILKEKADFYDEQEEREREPLYRGWGSTGGGPDGRGYDPEPEYEGPELDIDSDMNVPIENFLWDKLSYIEYAAGEDYEEFYRPWMTAYEEGMKKRQNMVELQVRERD